MVWKIIVKGRTQREEVSDTRKKKTWREDALKLCPANEFWRSLLPFDFRTNGKNERNKCCILQGMNAISEEYKFAKKSKCLQPQLRRKSTSFCLGHL